MKILVIGANGQVGSELCLLDSSEHHVIGLTKSDLDITNVEKISSAILKHQPDYIVNASAYTAVDKAEDDIEQAYAVNRDGPGNLAILSQQHNIPLIHISTDYVFNGKSSTSYKENDMTQPLNIYGKSKLAGEQAVTESCEQYVILRTSWVFGRQGNNFVKTMMRLAQARDEISVVSDQFGCPTAAHDIAAAIITICQILSKSDNLTPLWGIYHFSGSPDTSWYKFAQAIFSTANNLGMKVPQVKAIPSSDYPTPAKRPVNTILNCEKIKHKFGIGSPAWANALESVILSSIDH